MLRERKAVVVGRQVLLPFSDRPVLDLVDAVSSPVLVLPPGARVIVVTSLKKPGTTATVLRVACEGVRVVEPSGRVLLRGLERVRLSRCEPAVPMHTAFVEPCEDRSMPKRRDLVATLHQARTLPHVAAARIDEIFASLEADRERATTVRAIDVLAALVAEGAPFEVSALLLIEEDSGKRLALIGDEIARRAHGASLDARVARALTAHVRHHASRDVHPPRPLDDHAAARVDLAATVALVTGQRSRAPEVPPLVLANTRYRPIEHLGGGAQGQTWRALDDKTGEVVCLKVFRLARATEWKRAELFGREVEALQRLDDGHPGIPVFKDVFVEDEGATRVLVMSFIEGETLDARRRRGPVDEAFVIDVIEQVLDILTVLHGARPPIVHRDVKPKNIIVRPGGVVALVDFGAVSTVRDAAGSTLVGTYGYMAPEQLYGQVGPATDVYALGATAIALLAGREPEDLPRAGLAIDVAGALPDASRALVKTLTEMLTPDPSGRPSDARALLSALQRRRLGKDSRLERLRDRLRRRR